MTIAREITGVTVAHTAKEFERWVANSEPGAVCEYHRGRLCMVVDAAGKGTKVPTAEMAWSLGPAILRRHTIERGSGADCGLGVVTLVQRRHRKDDYSYLAIKRYPLRRIQPFPVGRA